MHSLAEKEQAVATPVSKKEGGSAIFIVYYETPIDLLVGPLRRSNMPTVEIFLDFLDKGVSGVESWFFGEATRRHGGESARRARLTNYKRNKRNTARTISGYRRGGFGRSIPANKSYPLGNERASGCRSPCISRFRPLTHGVLRDRNTRSTKGITGATGRPTTPTKGGFGGWFYCSVRFRTTPNMGPNINEGTGLCTTH